MRGKEVVLTKTKENVGFAYTAVADY